MYRKLLSLALTALLTHAIGYVTLASNNSAKKGKDALLAAKVKAGVAHLGSGAASRVRVKLHDKSNYHGYITEIAEDHFVVADAKTGATAPIAYPEVKGIKGNNFSTGAKIGIGVAVAAAVAIVAAIVATRNDNEDEGRCIAARTITTPCPLGCVCIQ